MFNPFTKLDMRYATGFRQKGYRYMVSQTCRRAFDHFASQQKKAIQFTPYMQLDKASMHYQAIKKKDQYAAILDLENEKHWNKLVEMLGANTEYELFLAIFYNKDIVAKRIKERYITNIRRYVAKHTSWRVGKDESVHADAEVQFGDIYILLRYGSQHQRIKLEELEKV